MSAYQKFLDFFSMYNKERLDGLSAAYFSPMTQEERKRAFDYLLDLVKKGGSGESVNGLFLADPERAAQAIKPILESGVLNPDAEIAAAWNLYQVSVDQNLIKIFIKYMFNSDKKLREKAVYFLPVIFPTVEIMRSLTGMVLTESEALPLVHATNKLLECHGLVRGKTEQSKFSRYYKGLRSGDAEIQKQTIAELNKIYPVNIH